MNQLIFELICERRVLTQSIILGSFRLEKVNIRQLPSQAKILGTVVAVGGAMIMTMVRGPILNLPWTNHNLHHPTATAANQQDFVKGALMISTGCILWSAFTVLQVNPS